MKTLKSRLMLSFITTRVAILLGLLAFSTSHKSIAIARADDEAAVRDTLMKNALSFEKNDVAMASPVWANDESLMVIIPPLSQPLEILSDPQRRGWLVSRAGRLDQKFLPLKAGTACENANGSKDFLAFEEN